MTMIQRLIYLCLPRGWAERIRVESEHWWFRCCTCDHSRSVWQAGGVRALAASVGKRKLGYCPACARVRWFAVEWSAGRPTPDGATGIQPPVAGRLPLPG